jgi:hypothetical protein
MWIYTKRGFYSIVQDRRDDRLLIVRARVRGDLETLFPRAPIQEGDRSDYRFRCWAWRSQAIPAIAKEIENIDYPSYKDAIVDPERRGHSYFNVWAEMAALQERLAREERPR